MNRPPLTQREWRCEVCKRPSVTIDLVCGHRCAAHPPQFCSAWPIRLQHLGFPHLAAAYRRFYGQEANA